MTSKARGKAVERKSDREQTVVLEGQFLDQILDVEEVGSTLVVCTGEIEGTSRRVLVPFLSVVIKGTTEREREIPRISFSEILPIEGAGSLLAELSNGLAVALEQYSAMSSGELRSSSQQIKFAEEALKETSISIQRCRDLLSELPK